MPWPAVRCAGSPSMRWSRNVIRPARGRRSPEIVFMSVDLPAPFGPSTQTISPESTRSSAPHSTWKSP